MEKIHGMVKVGVRIKRSVKVMVRIRAIVMVTVQCVDTFLCMVIRWSYDHFCAYANRGL
jgi:hypothetical protein